MITHLVKSLDRVKKAREHDGVHSNRQVLEIGIGTGTS